MTSNPQDLYRDSNGELPPPWAVFPSYESGTMGWRMGTGESYLGWWSSFLKDEVGPLPRQRLSYLKRHPSAPVSWWKTAQHVWDKRVSEQLEALEDGETPQEEAAAEAAATAQRQTLRHEGLISDDIAYETWRTKAPHPAPWVGNETPLDAARYDTRVMWFWSRKLAASRNTRTALFASSPPDPWRAWADVARTQQLPTLDLKAGLAGLALMLAADKLVGPWDQGMVPGDAEDSFEMTMNPADAFALWMMSAFDDLTHQAAVMGKLGLPAGPWTDWVQEQTFLDG